MPLCLLHQKFLRLRQSKLYLHNHHFHNLEMSAYWELLINFSVEVFHRVRCKIIVFVRFCSFLIFLVQKIRLSDRDVSILLACTTFSLLLAKIWSMGVEVLDVIPVGTLISCFNSRVKQNSIYFLTSELIIYVIPFSCVYIFF